MLAKPAIQTRQTAPPPPGLRGLDQFTGSLARRAYLSLRAAILELTYRPGELLRKSEICDALGVSRSPVSEAIARLSMEGLVDVVPQAGTFVARFSMAEIQEGAFLREAIELAAIELLAPAISEAQLTELRQNLRLQEVCVEDTNLTAFYGLDREMHRLILAFTGYRKLGQFADTAWVHVNRARQQILPAPGRIAATLTEHRAILAALEAHDAPAARTAMRAHLRQLMSYLEPLERERPELFDPA